VLELLDGFGSHVNCYEANVFRTQHKILSLREEGDSSHINQAYDRLTAKNDKAVHQRALAWLQHDKFKNRHQITQWDLITCGIAAVKESFTATNTRPSTMIPFNDWIKKIRMTYEGLLQSTSIRSCRRSGRQCLPK
jgi:hypothetical protein